MAPSICAIAAADKPPASGSALSRSGEVVWLKVKHSQCCPKAPFRRVPRSIYEEARDVARELAKTEAFERSRRDRKLLVQFQGMIAEYERAQILERSRRGKRHRARQGEVGVLSGAPFGYRFIHKTDHSAAYYQIDEEQARVVRRVFELYSVEGLSIGAIARLLNEQAIPTCKQRGRWERSTVWGMLRNPAYKGQACFGKTMIAPRQRITRPIRLRGGIAPRNSASHERPREDWIPLLFRRSSAKRILRWRKNGSGPTRPAPRRTITPSVVQGLVSCASAVMLCIARRRDRAPARSTIILLGSDAWRRLSGSVCNNRPVRQDLLDEVVWTEVVRLLENPQLIQNELDRRLTAAREADPTKRREEALRRDSFASARASTVLSAYQEGLLSLDELRERMPNLRRREQADSAELQAIVDQSVDRATYLRLAETLTTFLTRLRSSADALDVSERQRVLRLLVKEILVGDDKIIIRHCIPLLMGGNGPPAKSANAAVPSTEGYLLRSRSHHCTLPCPPLTDRHDPVFQDARPKPFLDQADDTPITDPMLYEPNEPFLVHCVEERSDVGIEYVAHLLVDDPDTERVQRIMRAASGPESIREPEEFLLVDRVQQRDHRPLDNLVLQSRDRERALPTIRLGNIDAPRRQCPIRSSLDPIMQILDIAFEVCLVVLPCQPIHARRCILLQVRRTLPRAARC